MPDFSLVQLAFIIIIFVWSGFVRSGLGFGGAIFTLPFLLLVHNDPLFSYRLSQFTCFYSPALRWEENSGKNISLGVAIILQNQR